MAVVFKGPAGYRFQSVNSGFEGIITGLGAIPGDPLPSLVVAVTRFYDCFSHGRRHPDHHDDPGVIPARRRLSR